jgi:hypothetical protein
VVGATPLQAILLALSPLAAVGAAPSVAARRGDWLFVLVWALVVGGLWFIVTWTVFLATDLGHCPIQF